MRTFIFSLVLQSHICSREFSLPANHCLQQAALQQSGGHGRGEGTAAAGSGERLRGRPLLTSTPSMQSSPPPAVWHCSRTVPGGVGLSHGCQSYGPVMCQPTVSARKVELSSVATLLLALCWAWGTQLAPGCTTHPWVLRAQEKAASSRVGTHCALRLKARPWRPGDLEGAALTSVSTWPLGTLEGILEMNNNIK